MTVELLNPAADLARANPVRIRNETVAYRAARTAILAKEIELRRHIGHVAALRRALPPGGVVDGDRRSEGEAGPTDFAGLFGDRQTLAVYSYMFGPERARPCPMCTNLLSAFESNAADINQRIHWLCWPARRSRDCRPGSANGAGRINVSMRTSQTPIMNWYPKLEYEDR